MVSLNSIINLSSEILLTFVRGVDLDKGQLVYLGINILLIVSVSIGLTIWKIIQRKEE